MKITALIFIALSASQILASNIQQELEEDEYVETQDWNVRGLPGVSSSSSSSNSECKRDLLLIVDCSYSITRSRFNNEVKKFLKGLISSPALNVGPTGTHVSMIIFSSFVKTKLLFDFGEKMEEQELLDYIDGMDWSAVSGDRTRTDTALEIADTKIFTKNSPRNHRPKIPDVVILITDGLPNGKWYTKAKTIEFANDIKAKDVEIVAAAVLDERLDESTKESMQEILEKVASSKDFVLKAEFDNMDGIIDTLVSKSCIKPGHCICPDMHLRDIYVPSGESEAVVRWMLPEYQCSGKTNKESYTVVPDVQPGSRFPIGKHVIKYIYELNGNTKVECLVGFTVKANLCRGVSYDKKTQECCCGTVHNRKDSHECCGPDYFATSSQRCCAGANLVDVQTQCP